MPRSTQSSQELEAERCATSSPNNNNTAQGSSIASNEGASLTKGSSLAAWRERQRLQQLQDNNAQHTAHDKDRKRAALQTSSPSQRRRRRAPATSTDIINNTINNTINTTTSSSSPVVVGSASCTGANEDCDLHLDTTTTTTTTAVQTAAASTSCCTAPHDNVLALLKQLRDSWPVAAEDTRATGQPTPYCIADETQRLKEAVSQLEEIAHTLFARSI